MSVGWSHAYFEVLSKMQASVYSDGEPGAAVQQGGGDAGGGPGCGGGEGEADGGGCGDVDGGGMGDADGGGDGGTDGGGAGEADGGGGDACTSPPTSTPIAQKSASHASTACAEKPA